MLFEQVARELQPYHYLVPWVAPLLLVLGIVGRLATHPLRRFPGPWYAKLTPFVQWWHCAKGDEGDWYQELGKRYGPAICVAPNVVIFTSGTSTPAIYTAEKGGLIKGYYYTKYKVDGRWTIFSEIDPHVRGHNVRPILPLFSRASLMASRPRFERNADLMIERLKARKERFGRVELIELGMAYALGAMEHLHSRSLEQFWDADALLPGQEPGEKPLGRFKIKGVFEPFDGVIKYFYLPDWLFEHVMNQFMRKYPPEYFEQMEEYNKWGDETVDLAVADPKTWRNTFAGRMVAAGIAPDVIKAELKDGTLAGLDGTFTTFHTICHTIVRHPRVMKKIKAEIDAAPPDVDPLTLPYLAGTIKEVMRSGRLFNTFFPRVTLSRGLNVPIPVSTNPGSPSSDVEKTKTETVFVPQYTTIGVCPLSVHNDPTVFPEPDVFAPERWVKPADRPVVEEGVDDQDYNRFPGPTEEMTRDFLSFSAGPRACIGRNLGMTSQHLILYRLIKSGVLEGARPVEYHSNQWFVARPAEWQVFLEW